MDCNTRRGGIVFSFLKKPNFQKIIAIILMLMMAVVVVVSTIDLGATIVKEILEPPAWLFGLEQLQEILGIFLWVLIALELLESIKVYIEKHMFHVTTVMRVSIIAVARKVIVLNIHEYDGSIILGLAAIIVALTAGYFFVCRGHQCEASEEDD